MSKGRRTQRSRFAPVINRGKSKPIQDATPDALMRKLFRHMSSQECEKWVGPTVDSDPIWMEIAAALLGWTSSVWIKLDLKKRFNDKQTDDWNRLLWVLISIAQFAYALGIKEGYKRYAPKGEAGGERQRDGSDDGSPASPSA